MSQGQAAKPKTTMAHFNEFKKKLNQQFKQTSTHEFGFHIGSITDLVFTKEKNFYISASLDQSIKIWESSTQALYHNFTNVHSGHHRILLGTFKKYAINYLVSTSKDDSIKIWNIENKKLEEASLFYYNDYCICFDVIEHNNQILLATGLKSNKIEVWEIRESSTRIINEFKSTKSIPNSHSMDHHESSITDLKFMQRNADLFIVSSSSDKCIKFWNVSPSHQIDHFLIIGSQAGIKFSVTSLAIFKTLPETISTSKDTDGLFAWSESNNVIQVGRLDAGLNLILVKIFDLDKQKPINRFAFTDDGSSIVASTNSNHRFLLNLKNDEFEKVSEFPNRNMIITAMAIKDEVNILLGTKDGNLCFWNLELNNLSPDSVDRALFVSFNHLSDNIISASERRITRRDLRNNDKEQFPIKGPEITYFTVVHKITVKTLRAEKVSALMISERESMVNTLMLVGKDISKEKAVTSVITTPAKGGSKKVSQQINSSSPNTENEIHFDNLTIIGFSNGLIKIYDENYNCVGDTDDTTDKKVICICPWHHSDIFFFFSAEEDMTIKKWLVFKTENTLKIDLEQILFHPQQQLVKWIDVNPKNSDVLASCYEDRSIIVWNLVTGKYLHHFENAHSEEILKVYFCQSDYSNLISCAKESVNLWDLKTNRKIRKIEERRITSHSKHAIYDIKLTLDQRYLMIIDQSKIQIWNFSKKMKIAEVNNPTSGTIGSIVISPNSEYFTFASTNHGIRCWRLLENFVTPEKIVVNEDKDNSIISLTRDDRFLGILNSDMIYFKSLNEPNDSKIFQLTDNNRSVIFENF